MAHLVDCPECAQKLKVPDEFLGTLVKCPKCGQTFRAEEELIAGPAVPPKEAGAPAAGRPEEEGQEPEAAASPPRIRRAHQEPHRGVLILVLGILSIVTGLGLIFGPCAWALGSSDLWSMRMGRMDREGEGLTRAGYICGIIGTVACGPCVCLCCGGWIVVAAMTP
jgi:predicted Zn finger-like uncharacterized protein